MLNRQVAIMIRSALLDLIQTPLYSSKWAAYDFFTLFSRYLDLPYYRVSVVEITKSPDNLDFHQTGIHLR